MGRPNAPSDAPAVVRWQLPTQSTSTRMLPQLRAPSVLLSYPLADSHGAGTGGPPQYCNPQSKPRNYPRDCRNRAACRDAGAMGIPYRGFGLITLVGMTHDTSL